MDPDPALMAAVIGLAKEVKTGSLWKSLWRYHWRLSQGFLWLDLAVEAATIVA